MPALFRYKAKDSSGKTITGEEYASSRERLVIELERRNLTIVLIEIAPEKKKRGERILAAISIGRGKVKTFELVVLCRLLATMLHGGVPILSAMQSIADEMKNPKFKKVLEDVAEEVREGRALSEGFKKHPEVFSVLFTSIVEAGEKVGAMDQMLRRLSIYLESRERLARKIRSASCYPAFIVGFFIFAILIVTLFIIPRFQEIYAGFGAELPFITLIIFNVSNFIVRHIAFVSIAVIIAGFSLFVFITKTKKGRVFLDTTVLNLPIFGMMIKKAAVSKFCRTLSTLLEQGISITESLLLVGKTAGNILIEDASMKARSLIVEGETIPAALTKMDIFPPLMLQMAAVGVESGSLPGLLEQTANFYEEQVDTFINTLTAMIEPVLVVFMGAVIGVVVVALYLPIFRLGVAISGAGG